MNQPICFLLALSLTPALAEAQTANPSGHWKGAILAPGRQFRFEIDLQQNDRGWSGTATQPDENLKGIPLTLTVAGNSIKFHARDDQPFDGVFSSDAKTIDGETTLESYTFPFHMVRTGDAIAEKLAVGVAVPPSLEGDWAGSLEVKGTTLFLVLNIARQANGSTARIVNADQGGLILPAIIRQFEPALAIEITGGATWTGTLNSTGAELTGSYSEHGQSVTLDFRRAPAR